MKITGKSNGQWKQGDLMEMSFKYLSAFKNNSGIMLYFKDFTSQSVKSFISHISQ